jgi:hypothetical protein
MDTAYATPVINWLNCHQPKLAGLSDASPPQRAVRPLSFRHESICGLKTTALRNESNGEITLRFDLQQCIRPPVKIEGLL